MLIAHGMGQQIPFETLDSIAQALRRYDRKMRGHTTGIPFSTSVKYDDKVRLPRIELQLKSDNNPVEAHVYEAYWAPVLHELGGLAVHQGGVNPRKNPQPHLLETFKLSRDSRFVDKLMDIVGPYLSRQTKRWCRA